LGGLKRLLSNKKFTYSETSNEELRRYKTESDSVQMFLDEKEYQPSSNKTLLLKQLYNEYKSFCCEDGYRTCSNRTFSERLRNKQYYSEKRMDGKHIYIETFNNE
jgi:putative DNA primase/helicase